ncbi:MAG: diguanylate cyclase, partial [Desulforhopalus sp.]
GVYVPVTEKTQPNPFLDKRMRDLRINDDLLLTKINPSFMTRQLAELAASHDDIQFRLTSLDPIRPQNKPTQWEKNALRQFQQGVAEISEMLESADTNTFHYMAPVIAENSCLACHPKHRAGDILGGIRISLSLSKNNSGLPFYTGHLFLAVAGAIGILSFWYMLALAYRKIRRQAILDPLTGISNRRYFSEKASEELKRSRREKTPLSILMCDIDNFKDYNDHYGHTAGDAALKQVAQSMCCSIKRPGDFCARFGGEEFVLVLPETTESGALKVGRKIVQDIEELEIPHKASPLTRITISVGTATSSGDGIHSVEGLIQQADSALYAAKNGGRNRAVSFKGNT